MRIVRFIFPFLFIRNWHTGQHELSPPRLALFLGASILIVCGVLAISLLQLPVEYQQDAP